MKKFSDSKSRRGCRTQKFLLITIGIQPTHPETGYGYIQIVDEERGKSEVPPHGVFKVKTFAEKPNLATAQKFVESGDFFWNSGIFIWRADVPERNQANASGTL